NLVAGIGAQLAALPPSQKLGPSDLFLPADSLTNSYTLVLTLAALYSNASVAFNSVAGKGTDLVLATQGIAPTAVVASPESLVKAHGESFSKLGSFIGQTAHWAQTRDLVQNGVLPAGSVMARLNDSLRPSIGTSPGKLRLVWVGERADAG